MGCVFCGSQRFFGMYVFAGVRIYKYMYLIDYVECYSVLILLFITSVGTCVGFCKTERAVGKDSYLFFVHQVCSCFAKLRRCASFAV